MHISTNLLNLVLIIAAFAVYVNAQSFDSHFSIQIYHNLNPADPNDFSSRGNISVLSINTAEMTVNQKELTSKERDGLINLARNRKLYRVKTEVVGSDGIKNTFLTFSKACDLLQSKLHDFLTIQLDSNLVVLGVNHRPVTLESDVGSNCEAIGLDRVNEFSTVVTFKNTEQARVPDTAGFIQKMEREREARERGDTKDNRSFLQKYWMYLVPAVILLLISGITNPEAQQGGNGGR